MAVLLPETVIDTLVSGGGMRISLSDIITRPATTMEQFAAAARRGGAHITFVVGDALLLPATMQTVARIGQGHVTFDFVG
jgi:hypothetical protein